MAADEEGLQDLQITVVSCQVKRRPFPLRYVVVLHVDVDCGSAQKSPKNRAHITFAHRFKEFLLWRMLLQLLSVVVGVHGADSNYRKPKK